ncbi:MAG TPA: CDP-diacylglycerol--serine O-phosphatidyltransferase [Bryobacteraceae bacterium]|nr:CDP-diacylglycerol--serine O-phosphatidyltransferase [Bryobacteraceae bacterium]
MNLRERLVDPRSPEHRPRRSAYALPTLFTAANIFLGFYALLKVFEGAIAVALNSAGAAHHFTFAAMAIGGAVFFDGLDGRIARMTNTASDFGRELDSLADVITFGIAPAAMAFAWGVYFVPAFDWISLDRFHLVGYFLSFMFLLCGAARLARFNIQKNPVPKNPGRPDRKYFVGLPIPAAAGLLASIVYATDGEPITSWILCAGWLALVGLLSFLMVSTWRYPSFKDLSLMRPRSPLILVLLGGFIFMMVYASQPLLLGMASAYVASGIFIRIGGIVRRRFRPAPREPEHQVG